MPAEHVDGCPRAGRRRLWLGAAWEACAGCEESLRADNARLRAALGAKALEAAMARAEASALAPARGQEDNDEARSAARGG